MPDTMRVLQPSFALCLASSFGFTSGQNGTVRLIDSLEETVEPRDEVVRAVERERHRHLLPDDPPPLDKADVAAVLAVVAVVAHHEVIAGRHDLRTERR